MRMREEFPAMLRGFRERAGRSRNNLAQEVGVDPSYLTRIEHGDREPPRLHIVEALARALRLPLQDTNRLLVAVADSRSGESFEVHAPAEKALDVFRHPFAYAAAA